MVVAIPSRGHLGTTNIILVDHNHDVRMLSDELHHRDYEATCEETVPSLRDAFRETVDGYVQTVIHAVQAEGSSFGTYSDSPQAPISALFYPDVDTRGV